MPSKADEASTSHKHIDKLALICYNMLRLILERKRDAMSFSIDTTQFNGMYRAPLMLRLAGKLPYATALSVLCFVLTVVLAVIGSTLRPSSNVFNRTAVLALSPSPIVTSVEIANAIAF